MVPGASLASRPVCPDVALLNLFARENFRSGTEKGEQTRSIAAESGPFANHRHQSNRLKSSHRKLHSLLFLIRSVLPLIDPEF